MNNMKKLANEKEFRDVQKAGERLQWRTSLSESGQYKVFKVNESDSKAVKSVLGMINRIEKNNVSNNVLFAKLYIYFLTQEIRHHETTIFNDAIHKELGNLLSKPLELFYDAFTSDLYSNQLNRLTIKNGKGVVIAANRYKETFPPEFIKGNLNEMINKTLLNLS